MGLPRSLHTRIFIGMTAGVALGLIGRFTVPPEALATLVANVAVPLGQVFLRLIFMAVVPLVVAALVLGVSEIGDVGRVGRIGVKTLLLTLLFSGLAVGVGVLAVDVFQPGVGLAAADREALMATIQGADASAKVAQAASAKPVVQTLLELIPKNPLGEAVNALDGGLLPLMVFALAVGLAMTSLPAEKSRPLREIAESVYATMLAIIDFAMRLAPVGVAGLMFAMTATMGASALALLAKYALVVVGALAFQQIVVYGLAIRFLARRDPLAFFRDLRVVMLTAFSTASSSVTLPTSLETATDTLKLPKDVSHFVLTVGATANQNGTALYEGVTVLFLAQFFGVDLTVWQQLGVVCMSVLAGVGTAGVPGGSLPMIVIVLQSIGVPGAAIGIILGIDRLLDMSRTVLNVTGDLTIATCVAAWDVPEEGVLTEAVVGAG